jgi:hypothetical protein
MAETIAKPKLAKKFSINFLTSHEILDRYLGKCVWCIEIEKESPLGLGPRTILKRIHFPK